MSTIFAIRGIQPHLFKRSQAMRSINGQLTKRINDLPCSSPPLQLEGRRRAGLCGVTDQAAGSASETSCASLVSAQTSSRMTFSVTS